MMRATRLPLLSLFVGALSGALGACQALAGIDDRTYDPAGAGPSAQCKAYCALAKEVCSGTSSLYATDETCYGICKRLDPGNPNEPTGDTVACRANQLVLAQQTNEPGAPAQYCPHAGPTTNGACATNCETYCSLYAATCAMPTEPDDCVNKCKGIEDTGGFDVNTNYFDDTLQCRFVHISAATLLPSEHCTHAAMPAAGPCLGMDPTTTVPDCPSFCHLEMTECTGANQEYETPEQCLAVCGALDKGTADDKSGNTVACRKYHTYNALLDPDTHCSHTGPGGEGHCGSTATPDTGSTGNCESYCTLLSTACASDFNAAFKTASTTAASAALANCELDCSKVDGAAPNSHYTTAASGNNVQCRLLHVSRALSDPTECKAAQGLAAPCN